jgi:transposase
MLTIGVDAHKQLHVALAVDDAGRVVDQWQGPNSTTGWAELWRWSVTLDGTRQWGIEGAWNYGRGLAQYLVGLGETVYDINPRWTAHGRRARQPGKNDRLDAQAVALVVWREDATLPPLVAEDDTALLDLWVTERDAALAEATRLRNHIHQLLLHVDPEYRAHLPALKTKAGLQAIETYQAPGTGRFDQERAATIRRLAHRLRVALDQTEDLQHHIEQQAKRDVAPLTQLCGISLLTAGALAGILGPGRRFTTDAQLAAYAGAAPLEASSAGGVRHRLNRGGNRRLNAILYRIVLTQMRCSPAAQAYAERRVREGKTRREVVRGGRSSAMWCVLSGNGGRSVWQPAPPPSMSPLEACT